MADLRDVYDFIARDSTRYARAQVERLQETAARTRGHPKIGRPVPELPTTSWRELRSGNYRIIYRYDAEAEEIYVLAIAHVRRLLRADLVE